MKHAALFSLLQLPIARVLVLSMHAAKLHIMCVSIKLLLIASSFILCNFDTSTEASAPAVLSLYTCNAHSIVSLFDRLPTV